MKKLMFAATAAAMLLYAPLAQAATVFDLTFTGTGALFGSPSWVSGTGTVTVAGLTGSGFENASTISSSPKITDLDITLDLFHFDLSGTVLADIATFNNSPVGLSYTGVDTINNVFFTLNTIPFTDKFTATASKGFLTDVFAGTWSASVGAIGGVPEPATWAMLLLGFGGIGAMLRLSRRRQDVAAAAA